MTFGAFIFSAVWGVICAIIGGLATRSWLKTKGKLKV